MVLRVCTEASFDVLLEIEDSVALDLSSPSLYVSLSRFSAAGAEFPKSTDVPGVRGVLVDDPKDAKAPEPRPKADEAPLVGEATFVVVKGAMLLSGFDLLLKDPS